MYLLVSSLIFLEIALFSSALVALILAVRFFIASQKKLEPLLPNRKKKSAGFGIGIDRDGFLVPTTKQLKAALPEREQKVNEETKHELKELRDMLQLQQLELDRAVRQIEMLNPGKAGDEYDEEAYEPYEADPGYGDESILKIAELQQQLAQKESEIKELHQQVNLTQKLQAHFEEVQSGYEQLQEKVERMEARDWQSAETTARLDRLVLEVEQLEETIHKKEEKIKDVTVENSRLHQLLNQTEDRLSEARLQRQQLTKKVDFLEQINADIREMTESNRKMRTELRRVAELESMLNLITEERDTLMMRKRF
ncbi:MAG TPA: hypothetical protein VM871_01040 [Flavisolibacter sp.]|jgi:DNA repair exonuclease SbcCD ATPase subunit|nr:hypothetical protein [Flavisolibacter sp.]